MISPSLTVLEKDLRQAAARRAYADVQRLVVALCASAAEQVRSLPPEDAGRIELCAWLRELLDWTDTMLRVARAAVADEYRRIPFLKSYLLQRRLSNF